MNEEILTAAAGVPHQSPSVTASPRGSRDGGAGIAPARTLDMVTAEIKFLDAQAGRLVMGHALEIGRRLTEAKELVPYGEWGAYLEKELNYSQSTANKLMKVFQEFGASQMGLFGPEVESETFTNLTYSKALALLSVPREERADFLREVDAESMSTRELKEAIRERDEARKALQTSEARLADTQRTLADTDKQMTELRGKLQEAWDDVQAADEQAVENERALKARIAELESRPVEVAVQEPDPAAVEKLAAELANKAKEELEQQAAREVGAAEEKAAKAAAPVEKPEGVAMIGIDDFMKVELRTAQILAAEPVPKAKKLLKLQVDLGYEQRQVVSGIAKWYKPEDLVGKKIILVANLAPAKLCGVESNGMILASGEEDVRVVFLDPATRLGERVR